MRQDSAWRLHRMPQGPFGAVYGVPRVIV